MLKRLLTAVFVVALMGVVFGVLIPSFASYSEIWDAMSELSPVQWLSLAGVFLLLEVLKAAPAAIMVDRMSLPQSFVADESSKVASNAIPGPSGTIARLAIYRSYGLDLVDFTQATVVNAALNNGVTLLLPIGAIGIIISRGSVPGTVWAIAGVAAAIVVFLVIVVWLLLRRESSARALGEWVGSLFGRLDGLRGKTSDRDWGDAAADIRRQLLDGLRAHGVSVLLVLLAKHIVTVVLLTMSLRFSGVTDPQLTVASVFIVYALFSVITSIQITPGGVGVAEATLIAIGVAVAEGAVDAQVTAGVLIFRIFTYLGPMILGLGCILVWKQFMGGGALTGPSEAEADAAGNLRLGDEPGEAATAASQVEIDSASPEG